MGILRFDLEYGAGNGFATKSPPKNSESISAELSWTNQFANATVNGVDFVWVGQNAKDMWAYKNSGLSGGLGITEGIGLRIYEKYGTGWYMFFDGYVNLSKAKWECDQVAAPSVQLYRTDWFVNKVKGFSFSYLKSIGVINYSDYKRTPYCVVKISQAPLQEALMALTELAVLKQGFETVRDISTLTSKTFGDAPQDVAGVPYLIPPTRTLADTFQIGFDVVYLIACGTTLIVEAKKIIDSIWQFKKWKLCMREETIWKKICQHFQLQFSSTIYSQGIHKNKTWMPRKNAIRQGNTLNFTRGYSEVLNNTNYYGYPDGLASTFIANMCDQYFGEVAIRINPATGLNTLYFERRNNFNNVAVYTITNTAEGQVYTHNLPQPYMTNLTDLPWNYEVIYAIDPTDETTGDSYKGTSCSKNIHQTIIGSNARVSNGTGTIIQLTSSIARRKNHLTKVENLLNTVINAIISVLQAADNLIVAMYNGIAWVINLFGGNVQPLVPYQFPTNLLNNRLGWMEVTDDKFSTPKSFVGKQVGSDWVLDPNSESICSAQTLMNDFHQFALPTHGAQQELYSEKSFKMCVVDFISVQNTNVITSPDGRQGKFTKMTRTPHDEMCRSVDYGIFQTQTNNLSETTSIDGV